MGGDTAQIVCFFVSASVCMTSDVSIGRASSSFSSPCYSPNLLDYSSHHPQSAWPMPVSYYDNSHTIPTHPREWSLEKTSLSQLHLCEFFRHSISKQTQLLTPSQLSFSFLSPVPTFCEIELVLKTYCPTVGFLLSLMD